MHHQKDPSFPSKRGKKDPSFLGVVSTTFACRELIQQHTSANWVSRLTRYQHPKFAKKPEIFCRLRPQKPQDTQSPKSKGSYLRTDFHLLDPFLQRESILTGTARVADPTTRQERAWFGGRSLTQLKGTCQRRCLHNSLRQTSCLSIDPVPLTPPAPQRHDASPAEDRVHSSFRWTRRRSGSGPFPLAETRWCSCDLHFSGCGDPRDLFVGFKRARVCCPIPRQALGRGLRRIGFEFIHRSRCLSWFGS